MWLNPKRRADYLKILVVLINKGKGANGAQILKEATVKEMFRDQIGDLLGGKALDIEIPGARPDLSYPVPYVSVISHVHQEASLPAYAASCLAYP